MPFLQKLILKKIIKIEAAFEFAIFFFNNSEKIPIFLKLSKGHSVMKLSKGHRVMTAALCKTKIIPFHVASFFLEQKEDYSLNKMSRLWNKWAIGEF